MGSSYTLTKMPMGMLKNINQHNVSAIARASLEPRQRPMPTHKATPTGTATNTQNMARTPKGRTQTSLIKRGTSTTRIAIAAKTNSEAITRTETGGFIDALREQMLFEVRYTAKEKPNTEARTPGTLNPEL
jgi:hypothetical protein